MYVLPFLRHVPALHQQWCRHVAVVHASWSQHCNGPQYFFAKFPLKNSWFRLILSETYSFISSCVFLIGTSASLPKYRGTTGSNPAWPSACQDFWTGCWWSNDFFDVPAFFLPLRPRLCGDRFSILQSQLKGWHFRSIPVLSRATG